MSLPRTAPVLPVAPGVSLRLITDGDIDGLVQACQDPLISRWTLVPSPYTRADGEFFVGLCVREWAAGAGGSLVLDGDGEVLGTCGIVGFTDGDVEIGYWIAAPARGRGLATAATTALRTWAIALPSVTGVILHVHPDNVASRAVALRAGFVREASAVPVARTGELLDRYRFGI